MMILVLGSLYDMQHATNVLPSSCRQPGVATMPMLAVIKHLRIVWSCKAEMCCFIAHCLQEPIPTSLLRLAQDHVSRAVKMFAGVQGDSTWGPAAGTTPACSGLGYWPVAQLQFYQQSQQSRCRRCTMKSTQQCCPRVERQTWCPWVFAGILRFCGDVPSGELPSQAVAVETAQKLLHQVRRNED